MLRSVFTLTRDRGLIALVSSFLRVSASVVVLLMFNKSVVEIDDNNVNSTKNKTQITFKFYKKKTYFDCYFPLFHCNSVPGLVHYILYSQAILKV